MDVIRIEKKLDFLLSKCKESDKQLKEFREVTKELYKELYKIKILNKKTNANTKLK